MNYKFSKEIYNKSALLKAAYNYTKYAYIHIDADEKNYSVKIEMKPGNDPIEEKNFENEILAQMVRIDVQNRTKTVREMILARALSSTVIEEKNADEPVLDELDINNILKDWFEKYE